MVGEININQFGSGLQALYHLEDVNDSSGNGNTLTNTNSVAFNNGLFRNGADFSSANTNKVLSRTATNGYAGGAYTIGAWVRLLAEITAGGWSFLFIQDDASDTQLYIYYLYNGGTLRLSAGRNRFGVGGEDKAITKNIALGTSKWHHIALTYDGTTLTLFYNGAPEGTNTSSGNGSVGIVARTKIGATDDGSGTDSGWASAIIDEAFFYNKALTPNQIKDYYAWALGRRSGVL